MFTKSADKLTEHLIKNGFIPRNEHEIYKFGLEAVFAVCTNVISAMIIGFILRMPLETLLFLAAFIPLRQYIGGFHTANNVRCFFISAIAVTAVLLATRFVLHAYSVPVIVIISGLCAIIMFFIVPIADANRPLDDVEKRVFGRRARIVLCVELTVLVISIALGLRVIASIIFCTLLLAFISSCAGMLNNYISSINTSTKKQG